jgi:hypothetical protein
MLKSWQALEEFSAELLVADHPVLPKGSGNAKKEEDIIGDSTITQCKYTEDKNMSILNKDLQRLLDACKLQDKFPLFITSNSVNEVLSIPITKDTYEIVDCVLRTIICYKGLEKAEYNTQFIKSLNDLNTLEKIINKLFGLSKLIGGIFTYKLSCLSKTTKRIYDDLTMYDLFEGEKNGVK